MHSNLIALMIFAAIVLTGCAGDTGDDNDDGGSNGFQVSGTVNGLSGTTSLELSTNSGQEQIDVSGSSFRFQQRLTAGQNYSVAVRQQPSRQNCTLNNASGVVGSSGPATINLGCSDLSASLAFVSGTIIPASNIVADSDLNDPNSEFTSNSTFSTAQSVDNLVTIQGFATEVPTRNFNTFLVSRSRDRFFDANDRDDYFRVSLQAGQVIQLQVVDYDEFDVDNVFAGDLDLYLYNEQFDIVSRSISETEFEELIVPASGTYLVNVFAFSGASKYVLKINSGNAPRVTAHAANTSVLGDFVANEAVVQFSNVNVPLAMAASSSVSFRHTDTRRATLASFSNTQAAVAALSASSANDPAMEELAALNPQSYEKVMTLRRIKQMRQMPGVESAEPNFLRYAMRVPNDEYYDLQWHYPAMNLPQAWDITTGTPATGDVIVAVIDTGVVLSHPELSNNLVSGYDFISDNQNSGDSESGIDNNPDDPGDGNSLGSSSWHGTHVAGTVAAESNNSFGLAGVSWGAKVMPLRVLGKSGGTSYDILQSVRFAAGLQNDSGTLPAQRADILNLSLGGGGSSASEASLYQQVHDLGVIVVAAAGNENTSQLSYPASYDGVISVSALDFNGDRAPYSNFGSAVDIGAPGGNVSADSNRDGQPDGVLSALVDDSSGSRQPVLAFYQGTSMASPHVAGMFALMKAVFPGLTSATVDSLLQSGQLTNDAGNPGRDDIYGFGSADALQAVQAAQSLAGGTTPPELPASLVASPNSLTVGTGTIAELIISSEGGGSPVVTGVTASEDWLSVAASQTDASGLGSYTVSVDRAGLSDGLYIGNVVFNVDSAASVTVRVSMAVGDIQSGGSLAEVYVLLYDPLREATVFESRGLPDGNGNLSYSFSQIPAGSYLIFAGTDVDNDNFICQSGEGCGSYPSLGDIVRIEVNGTDVRGIDFISDIVAGFGNLDSLSAGEKGSLTGIGLPRPIVSKKLPEVDRDE